MSFQHFRLGELSLHQPLPPHLSHHQGTTSNINGAAPNHDSASQFVDNTFPNNPHKGHTNNSPSSGSKQPYGSGDTDDGYTLVFPNLDAFHDWRNDEEERQMVEFVKVRHALQPSAGAHAILPRVTPMVAKPFHPASKTTPSLCAQGTPEVEERSM